MQSKAGLKYGVNTISGCSAGAPRIKTFCRDRAPLPPVLQRFLRSAQSAPQLLFWWQSVKQVYKARDMQAPGQPLCFIGWPAHTDVLLTHRDLFGTVSARQGPFADEFGQSQGCLLSHQHCSIFVIRYQYLRNLFGWPHACSLYCKYTLRRAAPVVSDDYT